MTRTAHPVHTRVLESREEESDGLIHTYLKARQVQNIMREQGQQLKFKAMELEAIECYN